MSDVVECERYWEQKKSDLSASFAMLPYVIGTTGILGLTLGLLVLRKVWNPKDKFQFVNAIIALELAESIASIAWVTMYIFRHNGDM